jgi:hypothetical protein
MASSGLLRRVAVVRTDVSEELSASFIRVTRIGELRTTLAATSNRRTLRRKVTRATRRDIPEDTIHHSHRRENLKSYRVSCGLVANIIKFPTTMNTHVHYLVLPVKLCTRQDEVTRSRVLFTPGDVVGGGWGG